MGFEKVLDGVCGRESRTCWSQRLTDIDACAKKLGEDSGERYGG